MTPSMLHAAGVTLITHGYNSSTGGWVTGMANALSTRLGGNIPIYRINVTSGGGGLATSITKISGGNPLALASGELIVMLDWGPVSSDSTTTFNVAETVSPLLAQTNFIAELAGHALAEFPIHVIGHSRGGSLVCELSQRLGEMGLWVDQVTTLDAFPLGGDAPVAGYENVLFAESFYQTDYFFDGQVIPGSHWRRQTIASGGYGFPYDWHSDVHLWYHGTIDLNTPASNTETTITSTMRNEWWTAVEHKGTNAGFISTRRGGGDRLSTLQPNGANSSPIRDGVNQNFDLGAGIANNRTSIMFNSGDWPNVIQLAMLTTNPVAHGASADLQIHFQWAQPASLMQSVEVFLDADQNPLNGNELLVMSGTASGTTGNQIGAGIITVPVEAANAPAGMHAVFVRMSANGRSRVLYAPTTLSVIPSLAPPVLDIARAEDGVMVGVNGAPGQTVVLLESDDLNLWQPMATNVLSSARWEIPRSADGTNAFYRALLLP